MRTWKVFCLLILCGLLILTPGMAAGERDLGQETLAPNDGWAAFDDGMTRTVTGGAGAAPDHIYTVHNRQELVAALYDGVYPPASLSKPSNVPKIIYVDGVIDANVDDNNQPLTCPDYYRDGFTMEAFLAAYDPDVWGRNAPSGPLEAARLASRNAQQDRVRIRVGSNTTIVGVDSKATIRGAWLDIRNASDAPVRKNIIIRNLNFQDTFDCFPEWSPTDGDLGAWNALYDAISLRNAERVWIDHNQFEDLDTADETLPNYFGVIFQVHDGLLDITNASDFVTVSWNRFLNHDKTMLIGSSDSAAADRGKLRVTLHHNYFSGTGQRVPRVRFGKVHIYDNVYKIVNNSHYVYAWGVGKESQIYTENNTFITDQSITPAQIISVLNGTAIHADGTRINGTPEGLLVDVVAEYNAANEPDLSAAVSWTPALYNEFQDVQRAMPAVLSKAGPFNW